MNKLKQKNKLKQRNMLKQISIFEHLSRLKQISVLKCLKSVSSHIVKFITFRVWFRGIYCLYAKRPVQKNKVLFVEVREPAVSDSFRLLYAKLKKQKKYCIHTHYLRSGFSG